MAYVISGLASGSSPTMYFDLDITETSRDATYVTFTVTCYAHLYNQTYDYDNYSTTPHISMGGAATIDIGTFGAFGKGAGTRSVSTTYRLNVGASGTNVVWTFSSTQVNGGTSSTSTGYVAGISSNGSTYPYAVASTYATTPTQPEGWSFWDGDTWGVNGISTYYRENFGTDHALVCWNGSTGGNGSISYHFGVCTDGAWTYYDTTSTNYTIIDLGSRANVQFSVKSSNTVGSTTLWSNTVTSSTYYRNTMQGPSLTSSANVTYNSTSFNLSLGTASDNLGTAMTYSITGLNYTTLSNSTGDPSTVSNKWVTNIYPHSMASGTIPAYSNISGVTPSDTKIVVDQTDLLASAKFQNRDNFITKFSTCVYLSSAKTVSFTMSCDDTARFYLNGASLATCPNWQTPATFSVNFPAGWSTVDIMQAEWGGGEALTLTPSLSSQVTTMIAERNSFLTSAGTVTINTNNASTNVTTGNYLTWANMKAAALAGTTASNTSTYKATLDIQVRAINAYGTTRSNTISIPIDLGIDAPISGTPTIAVSGSTYTINGSTYYFPKYRPITLNLTSNILDALGRTCTQDIVYTYIGADTVIKNVTATTTSTTVNDSDLNISNYSKDITFKARAKTLNGVTKDSTLTAPITANYWLNPIVSTNNITRNSTSASFGVTVTRSTSLTIATANTITLTANWTKTNDVGNTTIVNTFTVNSPTLLEADKPTVTVTVNDPVGVALSQPAITVSVPISVFIPAMAIRDIGIGINAIPDSTARLRVGGNVKVEGDILVSGGIGVPTTATISNTSQGTIISSQFTAPIKIKNIKGKTLENIFGKWGNFEYGHSTTAGASVAADTSNHAIGNAGIAVTATGTGNAEHYSTLASRYFRVKPNSYYIVIGMVKPVVGKADIRAITYTQAQGVLTDMSGTNITDTTKFSPSVVRFQAGATAALFELRMRLWNAAGVTTFTASGTPEKAIFDAIRMYEITSTEYSYLGGLTADQIEARYPYVDSIAGIVNPTVQVVSNNFGTTNLVGKVLGSNVENPNNVKVGSSTFLAGPSVGWGEGSSYSAYQVRDGTCYPVTSSTNGYYSQMVFGFDLISYVERKYGSIPSSDKVGWVKANIDKIGFHCWGYGSGPSGNKAYLAIWRQSDGIWIQTVSHTSSSVNEMFIETVYAPDKVDSNGFVYMNTYADASNGTIASTINTDYVSLDVTLSTDAIFFIQSAQIIPATLHNINGFQEEIFSDLDGKLKKRSYYKTIDLTIDMASSYDYNYSGYKKISIKAPGNMLLDKTYSDTSKEAVPTHRMIGFDGRVLYQKYDFSTYGADCFTYGSDWNTIGISVADTDSGWGASYTPTLDEVKAYLNGWRMYLGGGSADVLYNGSGTKAWCYQKYDRTWVHFSTDVQWCLNSKAWEMAESIRMPYKLIYKLTAPTIDEINPIGEAVVANGNNTIVIRQGIILNEPAKVYDNSGTNYYINALNVGARTIYAPKNIIGVYKNGTIDSSWGLSGTNTDYGEFYTYAYNNAPEPYALSKYSYSISYEMNPWLTATNDQVDIEIPSNSLTSMLDSNVKLLADHGNKIDALFSLDGANSKVVGQGFNGNGYWIRFSDGIQICWREDINPANYWSWSVATIGGSSYYYTSGAWNFPAAFAIPPVGSSSGDIGGAGPEHHFLYNFSATACTQEHGIYGIDPRNANTMYVYNFAIGRWK